MSPDPGSPSPSQPSSDPGPGPTGQGRRGAGPWDIVRGLFLVSALGFGWWGLREYHLEIGAALSRTSPVRVLASMVVVLAGLAMTGAVWRTILAAAGHSVPARPAAAIFFIGQLGKYLPGSVWSLGAQADMARRFAVPVRTTVAVGLAFLWVHVASALPVAALLGLLDAGADEVEAPGPLAQWTSRMPAGAVLVASGVTVVALSPAMMRWIGRLLAGPGQSLRLRWAQSAQLLGFMAVVWVAYGLALVLVLPPSAGPAVGGIALFWTATAAFAAAYVLGVVFVLAPAGAAIRELTLIGLLAPLVGVPAAAAAAILIRVVHTVADFTMAGLSWLGGRAETRSVVAARSRPRQAVREDSSEP